MKTIPIVLSFAALVATGLAQKPAAKPTPSQEIAPLVAVEEQEGDLKRAETLYREAIAGTALSADARQLLTLRLAELLHRLGRRDEAKQVMASAFAGGGAVVTLDDVTPQQQQDGERVAALRKKAAELVQKVLQQHSPPFPAASGIFDGQLRSQLLWLGPAAIPEIAAALAGETRLFEAAKADNQAPAAPGQVTQAPAALSASMQLRREAVAGLAGVIWEFGGEAAESHLDALFAKVDAPFRRALVQFAWQAREPRMLRLVERWLQQEQDDEVAVALLACGGGEPGRPRRILNHLDMGSVLTAVTGRSARLQTKLLELTNFDVSASDLAKLHDFARRILAGTDPDLGRVAESFLLRRLSQSSPVGIEILIEQMPKLSEGWDCRTESTPVAWRDKPSKEDSAVRRDVAVSLWPKLVRCARDMPWTGYSSRSNWVNSWLQRAARNLDEAIVQDVIDLVDLGWLGAHELLAGKVTTATAERVFRLYDVDSVGPKVLSLLVDIDLPAELFGPLVERAEKWLVANPGSSAWDFCKLIANTGHPEAAPWLVARAKAESWGADNLAPLLIACGRRSSGEPVRAAMRSLAGTHDGWALSLHLALLSMHDTETLARIGPSLPGQPSVTKHPYARAKEPKEISPLAYVLMDQPDPPHGFTEAELLEFARDAESLRGPGTILGLEPSRVPTTILMVLAARSDLSVRWAVETGGADRVLLSSWQQEMARRIAAEPDLQGPLHRWLDGALAAKGPVLRVVEHLGERDREAYRPQLQRMLAGDDLELATFAFEQLHREKPFDYEALTNSKHPSIAYSAAVHGLAAGSVSIATALRFLDASPEPEKFAGFFGDQVAVEAVPALLRLVQHKRPDVRQAANEALTKIRFVHEQKSYWDRITKGLDASPTSAVEKLLLQGKPGAPAEQRLLAITSLGALGMPEALPFLIEWTQDADAGIAKAAKDAITQIHLQPRR
jgi:HEAT repeat protein